MSARTERNRRILFAALAPTLCLFLGGVVGLALLPTALAHLTGTPTTARVGECHDPDPSDRAAAVECSATWTVDGREVKGTLTGVSPRERFEGRSIPVRVRGSSAVPAESSLRILVPEAAAATLTVGAFVWLLVAVWRAGRARPAGAAPAPAPTIEFPEVEAAAQLWARLQSGRDRHS